MKVAPPPTPSSFTIKEHTPTSLPEHLGSLGGSCTYIKEGGFKALWPNAYKVPI